MWNSNSFPYSTRDERLPSKAGPFHVICGRDVGLFSLVQQVVSQIPWALAEGRVPIVYFADECCYWTKDGFRDAKDSVWEYYFEPVIGDAPTDMLTADTKQCIRDRIFFDWKGCGGYLGELLADDVWVSPDFGDHALLSGKTLTIPYLLDDPGAETRNRASLIIRDFVRPRSYILEKVQHFWEEHFIEQTQTIGVHIRGTDADSAKEQHYVRRDFLDLPSYTKAVRRLLRSNPRAKVFVATDDERSLDFMKEGFGDRIIAYDSIRHSQGITAGSGPVGALMPAYIANNSVIAAQNGMEAVIEYLLLSRCKTLVHNGSSLARTVLLSKPQLKSINLNPNRRWFRRIKHRLIEVLNWV